MEAPQETRKFARALRGKLNLPEGLLWRQLKARQLDGLHFRKQHPVDPYVLDFYCDAAKLCVEIDGQGHGFGDRPVRDERRDAWLAERGIRTLRLSARLVLKDMDAALRTIQGAVEES